MSGWSTAILVGLRSLVVVIAMVVVGLGAWSLYTIRDANARGGILVNLNTFDNAMTNKWQSFLDEVTESQLRLWIYVGVGSFSLVGTFFVFLSQKVHRLKVTPHVAITLEFFGMLGMAAAFAMSLVSTLKITPLCDGLDTFSSPDLASFHRLCPISAGSTAAGGVGCGILLVTSISSLISACHRSRQQKACSFEPTVSALGMGREHVRINPPKARDNIPTIYDPRKPFPGTPARPKRGDEIGFTNVGATIDRRDSGLSDTTIGEIEKELISGPLSLEKPDVVKHMRPARPWSEIPKRKG
ncbi:hypothetical protein B0J11DRAFT_492206 [Dendryphion nanum]|uniref:Uncharacterized protein n=1 Tax=Dendryphion nanum TaxID=256645 RepID=A0A9P9DG92_9PLEO|nr:hypothetical protein B0J11DRAFT_492206 [Dendryphion nanum]